jgi:hypothetical protein
MLVMDEVGIPPNVQSVLNGRYRRVVETQGVKRRYIRVYGRDRGLYEYCDEGQTRYRKTVADDWREARRLLSANGYVPRRFVAVVRGVEVESLRT